MVRRRSVRSWQGYRTPTTGRVCVDDMPLPGSGLLPGADDLAASGAGGESARADAGGSEEGDSISERLIEGLGIERDWW